AAQGKALTVLDGPARSYMERVRTVHVRRSGAQNQRHHRYRSVRRQDLRRCLAPDEALRRNELRHGQGWLSGNQYDPSFSDQILSVAKRQDWALLSFADRSGMGVCVSRRNDNRVFVG